jgi:fido (protein-threonine AMPylation protein)
MGRPSRQELLQSLDQARADLLAIGGLPEPMVFHDIWADIWTEETHHSTALEGNTLRKQQVRMLLERGLVSGQTTLREVLEARAYGSAARWVYEQAHQARIRRAPERKSQPKTTTINWASTLAALTTKRRELITEAIVRELHKLVVGPVWTEFPPPGLVRGEIPGAYRLKDHDALRHGLPPLPSSLVPSALAGWVEDVNENLRLLGWWTDSKAHTIEDLARVHAAFERIHPFPDGNGRVGRLVLTHLLVRAGYPPAIIEKDERKTYLKALKRADEDDCGALTELLARSVRGGIYRFLIPKLAGNLSVVPLAGLAREDGPSHSALVAAAQRGRLKAQKVGGTWYSTRKWVEDYEASRYKRKAA